MYTIQWKKWNNQQLFIMLIKRITLLLTVLSLCFACQSQTQKVQKQKTTDYLTISDTPIQDALKIAYVGNMGVLLEHNHKTVIIDGLHQFYHKNYVHPTKDMVNRLVSGTFKNFSPIEFCLFTHVHGDHFSERYTLRLLEAHPEVVIMGSQQISDSIQKIAKDTQLMETVKAIPYDALPHTITKHGIEVTGIQCYHSSPSRHGQIKNIAFLVNIDGYNIVHVGDTDWDLTVAPFKTLDIKNSEVDLAVIPYWMLLERGATKKIMELLSPKHIIATHIPPNFSHRNHAVLNDKFQNITLLTQLGEVLYIKN